MSLARVLRFGTFLIAGSLIGRPATAETNVKFVLDWAFQGQQAAFTTPVDDGTFKKLGLNVTVDRGVGSADTVVKVASGAYDMGYADLNAMIRFNEANPNQRLIAVFIANDKATTGLATKASSGIKLPKDLEGKKVASPLGDGSRQLFPLFAKINKVDESKVEWLNISPELREPMLIRGQVDAISGDGPTVMLNMRGLNIPEKDIKIIPYGDFGLDLYGKAVIVRPDYAKKNPEVIRNFLRGVVTGMNGLIRDPAAAVASVRKRDPLLNDSIETARIKATLDYAIVTPNVAKNGYSNVDLARLDRTLKALADGLQFKTVPRAADVYTADYLPARTELKMAQ
jgi:NitT/TauT family transport system substrate-binding protein